LKAWNRTALRSGSIFRTARTALAKPTSSSKHPLEGSGTKADDRNQEVGVCPCALQAQKNGFVRKSTCRSQSQHQHFAIRSFLREALRAKPKMSWRRLYLIKSAKLISEALKKGKTHGQREGCRSASRSHGIRKNEKQDFPSLETMEILEDSLKSIN